MRIVGLLAASGHFDRLQPVDAVEYFVHEILPLVRIHLPDIHLTIVGSNPPDVIRQMQSSSITVTGWVEDLSELYHAARIAIAPLRFGAGVKGKIGEALNYGVPAVTTSVGADGMGLQNRDDILIADSAQDFAKSIVDCHQQPELWSQLRVNGRKTIQDLAGSTIMNAQISQLLSHFCANS